MTKSMNAAARHRAPATIWHESGEEDQAATRIASRPGRADSSGSEPVATIRPLAAVVPATPPPAPAPTGGTIRRRLGSLGNGLIASQSLVSTDPVLDVRAFAWTAALRKEWRAIREEATAVAPYCLMPLWRDGEGVAEALARCPRTAAALALVPGLHDAAFATLLPGAHVPAQRGATKGLISCHLGLVVPRDGGARLRIHDRILRWAEGETLIFDDSFEHEIRNDAESPRIVLRIRFARPLRRPGRWIAGRVLRLLRGLT